MPAAPHSSPIRSRTANQEALAANWGQGANLLAETSRAAAAASRARD